MTLRRVYGGSRSNRDRRDQSFARAVIATATRLDNENAAREAMKEGVEVCPDCLGRGEIVRQVADDRVTEAICLECNGKGWIR